MPKRLIKLTTFMASVTVALAEISPSTSYGLAFYNNFTAFTGNLSNDVVRIGIDTPTNMAVEW